MNRGILMVILVQRFVLAAALLGAAGGAFLARAAHPAAAARLADSDLAIACALLAGLLMMSEFAILSSTRRRAGKRTCELRKRKRERELGGRHQPSRGAIPHLDATAIAHAAITQKRCSSR